MGQTVHNIQHKNCNLRYRATKTDCIKARDDKRSLDG